MERLLSCWLVAMATVMLSNTLENSFLDAFPFPFNSDEDERDNFMMIFKTKGSKITPVIQMADSTFGIPLPLDDIFDQISTLPADDMNPEECLGRSELAEYDMCLTQLQMSQFDPIRAGAAAGRRRRRMAAANGFSLWRNGVIPYVFNSSFASTDRDAIIHAMSDWEKGTCVRFRPANNEDRDVVIFRDGKRCSTNIGRIGREQAVTLGKSCLSKRILIHELGHVIGLIHEHQRHDRDKYVRVVVENIRNMTQERYQFSKLLNGPMTEKNVKYDYTSVMHYGKNYFARSPGLITLQPTDARYQDVIGRAEKPSHSDLETVNRLYKCSAGCPNSLRCGPSCFMDSICVCRCRDGADKPFFHGPGPFGNSLPDPTCEFFASQGECTGNIKDTIRPLCAKSCGLYQPKGNHGSVSNNIASPMGMAISSTSGGGGGGGNGGVGVGPAGDGGNWPPLPTATTNNINALQDKAPIPPQEQFWNSNVNVASANSLRSQTSPNTAGISNSGNNNNNLYSGSAGPSVSDVANGFVNANDNLNAPINNPLPLPPLISRSENTRFRQDQNNNYFPLSDALGQSRYLGSPPSSSLSATRNRVDPSGQPSFGMRPPTFQPRQQSTSSLVMSRSNNGRRARLLVPQPTRVRNRAMPNLNLGMQRRNYVQRKSIPMGGPSYVSASDLDALRMSSSQANGRARVSNSVNQPAPWMKAAQQRRIKQQRQQQQNEQQNQQMTMLGNGRRQNPTRNQVSSSWSGLNSPSNTNSYDMSVFNPSTFSNDNSWRIWNQDNVGYNFNNGMAVDPQPNTQPTMSSSLSNRESHSPRSGFQMVEEWQNGRNSGPTSDKIDPLVAASDKSRIGPEFGSVDSIPSSNRNVEVRPEPSIAFNQNVQANSPSFTKPTTAIGKPSSSNNQKPKSPTSNLQGIQTKHWEFQHQQQQPPMPTVMVDQSVTRQAPPGERHNFPGVTNNQNSVSAMMRDASQGSNFPLPSSRQRQQFHHHHHQQQQQRHQVAFLDHATRNTNRRMHLPSPTRPAYTARDQSLQDNRIFRAQANAETRSIRQEAPIDQMSHSNTHIHQHPMMNVQQRSTDQASVLLRQRQLQRQRQSPPSLTSQINRFQSLSDPFASSKLNSLKVPDEIVQSNNKRHSNNNNNNNNNNDNINTDGIRLLSLNNNIGQISRHLSGQSIVTANNDNRNTSKRLPNRVLTSTPIIDTFALPLTSSGVRSSRSRTRHPANPAIKPGGINPYSTQNMGPRTNTIFNNSSAGSVLSLLNITSPLRLYSSARYLSGNPSYNQRIFSSLLQRQNRARSIDNYRNMHSSSSSSHTPSRPASTRQLLNQRNNNNRQINPPLFPPSSPSSSSSSSSSFPQRNHRLQSSPQQTELPDSFPILPQIRQGHILDLNVGSVLAGSPVDLNTSNNASNAFLLHIMTSTHPPRTQR